MSTTSLKLPDDLKTRVQAVAQEGGFTSHAFMVGAVERAVEQAEAERAFLAAAEASLEDVRRGGPVYSAEDVHRWARARLAGSAAPEPHPIRGRGAAKTGKKIVRA